jgi:hypothetical protein
MKGRGGRGKRNERDTAWVSVREEDRGRLEHDSRQSSEATETMIDGK